MHVEQFEEKKYLIIKKVDLLFPRNVEILIRIFPKTTFNLRIVKLYITPCDVKIVIKYMYA